MYLGEYDFSRRLEVTVYSQWIAGTPGESSKHRTLRRTMLPPPPSLSLTLSENYEASTSCSNNSRSL